MSEVRSILEHQLAELVAEWSEARERKRLANQEFNEEIKGLEERIDGVLAEIKTETAIEASGQQRLPFERPEKPPTILPAEEPDSGSVNETAQTVNTEPDSVNTEPDAPTQEEREEMFSTDDPANTTLCATCGHTENVHGDDGHGGTAGCMAIDCKCRHFVPPDPLGINDVDPKAREVAHG